MDSLLVRGSLVLIELAGDYVRRIFDLLLRPNVHRACACKQFSRNQFQNVTIAIQDVSAICMASNTGGKFFFGHLLGQNRAIKE